MSVLQIPPNTQAPTPPVPLPYPTDPAQLPPELTAGPWFVAWRWGKRAGDWTKILIDPRTGRNARANDPATWGTFAAAVARALDAGLPGIGVVMTGDMGLIGLDLDHCRDPETGALAPWARDLVDRFGTYGHASPTGTGVHLFVKARFPDRYLAGRRGGRVKAPLELYQSHHFLTLTTEEV